MEAGTIGQRIYALRKKAGYSQEELGKKAGVSRQAVSRWELDEAVPAADALIALCAAFSVSADYFLFGTSAPAETKERNGAGKFSPLGIRLGIYLAVALECAFVLLSVFVGMFGFMGGGTVDNEKYALFLVLFIAMTLFFAVGCGIFAILLTHGPKRKRGTPAVGRTIYELRKQAGYSQEELGEKAGVSRQAVSRWELGEALPAADAVCALCAAFSVSADRILFGGAPFEAIGKKGPARPRAWTALVCLVGVMVGILFMIACLSGMFLFVPPFSQVPERSLFPVLTAIVVCLALFAAADLSVVALLIVQARRRNDGLA